LIYTKTIYWSVLSKFDLLGLYSNQILLVCLIICKGLRYKESLLKLNMFWLNLMVNLILGEVFEIKSIYIV